MTAKKFTSAQLRKIARDALEYETSLEFVSFLSVNKKKQEVLMEAKGLFGSTLRILAIANSKSVTLMSGKPLGIISKSSIFVAYYKS